jgi:hypothetical protein
MTSKWPHPTTNTSAIKMKTKLNFMVLFYSVTGYLLKSGSIPEAVEKGTGISYLMLLRAMVESILLAHGNLVL